jgi:divalent metal cation (Fe/Co/Zn/Cd) transporter
VTTWAFTRAVTIVAVGFLLLNAVLLVMINQIEWASVCARSAVLVVIGWFHFRQAMRELADARKEMKREVESLRQLLHTRRQD